MHMKKRMSSKSYHFMITLPTFEERLAYLSEKMRVGDETFGSYRQLNQALYMSKEWKMVRRDVIIRDCGCDLADPDRPIVKGIFIHHINPISVDDLLNRTDAIFDLDNLVCCSRRTHDLIHYGASKVTEPRFVERRPGDTCPWRKGGV